jgi:hypothetical protein
MIHNCLALTAWVQSAKRYPEMQEHTAAPFASEYKHLAYELAVKDAAFYALPHEEPYPISKIYRDFDLVAQGAFENAHDCFVRAEVAAAAVLLAVKDRFLSKRVAFSMSTKRQKRYFRENLPRTLYTDFDDPPSLKEAAWEKGGSRRPRLDQQVEVAVVPGLSRAKEPNTRIPLTPCLAVIARIASRLVARSSSSLMVASVVNPTRDQDESSS